MSRHDSATWYERGGCGWRGVGSRLGQTYSPNDSSHALAERQIMSPRALPPRSESLLKCGSNVEARLDAEAKEEERKRPGEKGADCGGHLRLGDCELQGFVWF